MSRDFMITPINDRYNGFTQIMHLSKSETKDLNRVIEQIAALQIQRKSEHLQFSSLPKNVTDFLKIHKKIESLKTQENDPAKIKFLEQINNAARKFEQIILQSLNTGNVGDLKEIEELCNDLDKMNNDPDLKKAINSDLYEDLMELEENMLSVEYIYQEISSIDSMLASYDENAVSAIEALAAKQTALESGESQFSLDDDLSILKLFDQLVGFYKKYEQKESLPLYHGELIARLTEEAYTLRFNHEEFSAEYQSAVEAEVLKTLQAIHQDEALPIAEEKHQGLLSTLIEEKNKIEIAKATLDSHIDTLNQPHEGSGSEALFKEFKAFQNQLESDLKFLQNQITMLSEKQTVGIWGRWTISNREKNVEHNVRVIREIEENVPNGWGKKLLLFSVWGLSKIGKFTALAQFTSQTYQAMASGESPLKPTAELMSLAAYARQYSGLNVGEQQKIEFDVSAIQGVLNGYIPFTETFAREHPEAARYLEDFRKGTADASENKMSDSYGNYFQHSPIQKVAQSEANVFALRYLGEQVREHFNAEGKQLEFENPNGSFESEFVNYLPEARPVSAFSLLAEELVESVKESKAGVSVEKNKSFQILQSDAKATFGAELPEDWFAGWIATQEWSEDRLDNLENWFAGNLECQARDHLTKSHIQVKNDATAVVFTSLNPGAVDNRDTLEMDMNASPNMRRFNVIEHLAEDIHPDQLFQNPLTSDTPQSYSPLKAAMDVYTFVAGKAKLF